MKHSRRSPFALEFLYFFVAKTIDKMIIHKAGGLHEGINDCGSAKFETTGFQIFRHFLRMRRFSRNIRHAFRFFVDHAAIGETPNIIGEAVTLLNLKIEFGACNRADCKRQTLS